MQKELQYAQEAALRAGEEILRFYKQDYNVRDKSYHNPVTDADHAADHAIKTIITQGFPKDGWLSEETVDSAERLVSDRVWIVDPLDGTKEFIEGVPNFVVSIALVQDRHPVLGILYNPVTKEIFHGFKGGGSYFNNNPIHCSSKSELDQSSIVISRSETRRGLWNGTSHWFGEQAHIGSVAYKLGLTAAGQFDCFATLRPKNEWDVCAGQIILKEAGGILVNLGDKGVRTFNQQKSLITPGLIGGNPTLVEAFYKRWHEHQSNSAAAEV